MEAYGHGPWHVVLLQDYKATTTKIVTHTHVSLLLDAMFEESKHKERWIPLLDVGPFERLPEALSFAKEWTDGARGAKSRIAHGERLHAQLQRRDIFLAIQSVSTDDFIKHRQWDQNENADVTLLHMPPKVKHIQAIEKQRIK